MHPLITTERDYVVVGVVVIQQSHSVVDLVVKVRTWYVLLAIIVKYF